MSNRIKVKRVGLSADHANQIVVHMMQLGSQQRPLQDKEDRKSRNRILAAFTSHEKYHKENITCDSCGQDRLSFGYILKKEDRIWVLLDKNERKFIYDRIVEEPLKKRMTNKIQEENLFGLADSLGAKWGEQARALVADEQPEDFDESKVEVVDTDDDDEPETGEEVIPMPKPAEEPAPTPNPEEASAPEQG